MNASAGELGVMAYIIPLWQVALYVLCAAMCMLTRKDRLGIIISYGFVLYWGYISHIEMSRAVGGKYFTLVYLIFGLMVFFLAIWGLLIGQKSRDSS